MMNVYNLIIVDEIGSMQHLCQQKPLKHNEYDECLQPDYC